jgi:hypothetical protein
MKNRNILPLSISLLVLMNSNTFSQLALNEKVHVHSTPGINDTGFVKPDSKAIPFNVNIRVQRSFILNFGDISENNWCKAADCYLNVFHSNGLRTIALFSKNGKLIYTIRYGSEKDLPADLRRTVKSEYYDYAITKTIELQEDDRDVWFVKLDTPKEQITVSLEDGDMEKVDQFQKTTN